MAKYSNESYSEDRETNKATAISNFMPKILPDNDIAEGINSLNSQQKEAFNVVHTWAKDYVKYNGHNKMCTYFSQAVEAQVNVIW